MIGGGLKAMVGGGLKAMIGRGFKARAIKATILEETILGVIMIINVILHVIRVGIIVVIVVMVTGINDEVKYLNMDRLHNRWY